MKPFRTVIIGTLISFVCFGCTSIGTSPDGLEIPIERAAIRFAADVKEGGYKIVGTEELKKWIDARKRMMIISTLPAAADKELGMLPSAINATMPRSEKSLTQIQIDNLLKAAGLDKDRTLVVYCAYVSSRRSHIGAKILIENGFANVYRYPAGIAGWMEMGYQLEK